VNRRSLLLAAPATLALAGCVTLLPKETPAQLYRFGGDLPPAQPPAGAQRFGVILLPITFVSPAAGDQILAVTGHEAAYLKGARWVTGAATLFEQALDNAFDADGGPARLLARGELVKPDYLLKLDVRVFEVRYTDGEGLPPTAVVQVYAALSADRQLVGERIFGASIKASENRGGAIASAVDQADSQVLGQLVKWVDAKGAG
jgi:cholesterol transport system auxiliary component